MISFQAPLQISNVSDSCFPIEDKSDNEVRVKRPYLKIEDERRTQLLKMVEEEQISMKEASKRLHINYYSAKTIMQTYRKKGRIHKKLTRDRARKFVSQITLPLPNEKSMASSEVLKPVFEVQKSSQSSTERSQIYTASEESDQTTPNVRPKFFFGAYKRAIEDVYMNHIKARIDTMKKYVDLTLPSPKSLYQ